MASRKIEDCCPELREKIYLFQQGMLVEALPFVITCTARIVKEQIALYAQGRDGILETNRLRRNAGLPAISIAENRRKVTWTLNSKHLIDLDDGDPRNDLARAFDIALTREGHPHWDIKADVNADQVADYRQAGEIGESVGLKWGGRFSSPDWVHFEV